jgi:hypothetical protein
MLRQVESWWKLRKAEIEETDMITRNTLQSNLPICRILKFLGIVAAVSSASPVFAVEGGAGFYILGSRTVNGGIVPPPGTYFNQGIYAYHGNAEASIARPGQVDIGLEATARIGLSTVLWSPQTDPILGGRPYLSGTLVYGFKGVDLEATLSSPNGNTISDARSEDAVLWGDPVLGAGLGWGSGPVFGSLNFLLNVPVGNYELGRPTNVAFNRWAMDVTGAVTWLDQESGWQADLAVGVTLNGKNEDTDYKSGDEFHVEAAVARSFASGWTVALQGYHYEQINGDSGAGATLGDFEGQVSGIGLGLSWAGELSGRPVSLDARYFHEFDVENRLEGDALLVSLTMPLGN